MVMNMETLNTTKKYYKLILCIRKILNAMVWCNSKGKFRVADRAAFLSIFLGIKKH